MAQELNNHLHRVFAAAGRWNEMVRSKLLIMIALYAILAIIIVFNFNFYHHLSVGWSKTVNEEIMEGKTSEYVETTTAKALQEFMESLPDTND
jgi:hypothetical protein